MLAAPGWSLVKWLVIVSRAPPEALQVKRGAGNRAPSAELGQLGLCKVGDNSKAVAGASSFLPKRDGTCSRGNRQVLLNHPRRLRKSLGWPLGLAAHWTDLI